MLAFIDGGGRGRMSTVGPLKATFFAFKKREKGGVLLGASISYLVLSLVMFAAFLALNWRLLGPVVTWYLGLLENLRAGATDPSYIGDPPAELLALAPGYLLVIFLSMVLYSAYEAACLRWMIRGQAPGLFGLTLGADTWRVWFVLWAWFFSFIALYITMLIIFVIVLAIGAGVLGTQGAMTLGLITVALMVAMYGVLIYFGVRTAPAAAATIAQGRFSFFDSWKVSKGRFWALFGSFLLLWILTIVAITVTYVVAFATIFGASGADLSAATDPEALGEMMRQIFSSSQTWAIAGAFYLLLLVLYFAAYIGMFGINARAAMVALEDGKLTPHNWGKE
jgi:hypothetical protein